MDIFLYISLALIIYVLVLILLKNLNFWKKKENKIYNNCCPCELQKPLERIRRKKLDYLINYTTFQLFDFKRYRCTECALECRRWDKPFRGKF